jgi:hypothetical protein
MTNGELEFGRSINGLKEVLSGNLPVGTGENHDKPQ